MDPNLAAVVIFGYLALVAIVAIANNSKTAQKAIKVLKDRIKR